jgi:protein TonB
MTAAHATEHVRFKLGCHRTFDVSLILAASIHILALLVVPGYTPSPIAMDEVEPITLFDFAQEVEVPLPPVPIQRPPVPLAKEYSEIVISDLADQDETIEDTEVEIQSPAPARLGYAGDATPDDYFEPYSTPPMEKKLYRPEYPSLARQAGIEGRVVAVVTIDERGRVTAVEIIQSPGEVFHQPVIDALMKSEFYPALQREVPVRASVKVPFDFYLR